MSANAPAPPERIRGPEPLLTEAQVQEIRSLRYDQHLTYERIALALLIKHNISLSVKTIYKYINDPYKKGR